MSPSKKEVYVRNLKNYINERGLGDKVKDEIVYVIYGTGLAEPRFSMVDVEK